MMKTNRIQRRNKVRLCIRCNEPVQQALPEYGVDPGYHLRCYLAYLEELRDKHGEGSCFFCQHFGILNGVGGKGQCPFRKRLVGASKESCSKFEGKIKLLQSFLWNKSLQKGGLSDENNGTAPADGEGSGS